MKQYKYNVGDRVRGIARICGHQLEIGKDYFIDKLGKFTINYQISGWCLTEGEIELVSSLIPDGADNFKEAITILKEAADALTTSSTYVHIYCSSRINTFLKKVNQLP